ncbi:MAG: tripartite tricarboxylate transporter substrate-binding protein, partial [Rectinema sp.]|nr:tripartite tricarboxylate transporter substrate-binding protein [Rectinema sp.]
MKKRAFFAIAILLVFAIAAPLAFGQATWKPNKPITIIVPWGAGGSTDQITRVCAAELESYLGQKIVIVNQPGASGSVGTKSAMDAKRDGYTWTAGAAADLEAATTLARELVEEHGLGLS